MAVITVRVLGGCGAWPGAGQACSGYLVEHDGFRLLIDPGYATLPRLLAHATAEQVDAVLVSHGHPDHCADLHPLLRARLLGDADPPPLPVAAPPAALDPVLALDGPGRLGRGYRLSELAPGPGPDIGPFRLTTWAMPHHVPNLGIRLAAAGRVLAYTGDTGPTPDVVELARGADLLIAEATFPDQVPGPDAAYLSSAQQAGEYADRAGAGRLLLTHLWPGTEPAPALTAAGRSYRGPTDVATGGLVIGVG